MEKEKRETFLGCFIQVNRINPQIIRDSFVFFWEKSENAKMRGIPDIFGDFEITLGKINDRAVEMSSIDEIVNDFVLILFADKVIKDDKSLRIIPVTRFMKRDDFSRSLDDGISNFGVNSFCKIIQEELILVLMKIFAKRKISSR